MRRNRAVAASLLALGCIFYLLSHPAWLAAGGSGDGAVAVVIVSQGRSESTALAHVLASMASAFLIAEPFRSWDPEQGAAPAEPVPQYDELFDCSFLLRPSLARLVLWPYACVQHTWPSPAARQRCQQGRLSAADLTFLHDECMRATLRVVKTIRFSRVSRIATIPRHARILLLVRRPSAVVRSQWGLGGGSIAGGVDTSGADAGGGLDQREREREWQRRVGALTAEAVVGLAVHGVCAAMLQDDLAVASLPLPPAHRHVVRYEELKAVTFMEHMTMFLGLTAIDVQDSHDARLARNVSQTLQRRYMDQSGPHVRAMLARFDAVTNATIVDALPNCRMLRDKYYRPGQQPAT